jgi:glycerol-3-phosphate dehydrogenase
MFASDKPPSGVPKDIGEHLWRAYGSEADAIAQKPHASKRLVDGLPYCAAEVEHAVAREMALSVADVLARRTRAVLFDVERGRSVAEGVAKLMAPRLGWNAGEVRRQVGAYEEEIRECSPS